MFAIQFVCEHDERYRTRRHLDRASIDRVLILDAILVIDAADPCPETTAGGSSVCDRARPVRRRHRSVHTDP
ncbi:hypothetical protein NJ7G_0141 [Natrinema sp. J7-2]|nr:hypothetical protein NJ7G_0141 [Natrinema sp. J7-2]